MLSLLEDFKAFLDRSPTSWHCLKEVKERLSLKDFIELEEASLWDLKPGQRYFVKRGGSLAAFCLPKQPVQEMLLLAAHTDSPALKLKPNPLVFKQGSVFLETEPYGSPILHSYLNRDLGLAGRVFFLNTQGHVQEELLFLDDIPLVIPELAIHLHREVNEKGPQTNEQDHLMPLLTLEPLQTLEELIRQYLPMHSLLSFDLLAVPLEPARFVGMKGGEMLSSYRLDNLTSVHASISALVQYQESPLLPLAVFWDHEEVGSRSWEGAQSTFLQDIFSRIRLFYSMTEEQFLTLKSRSFCISLDMAHGLHPLHSKKYDANHAPLLGGGIALKSHADLKYASSAKSLAKARSIAQRANIPLQHFCSRSDQLCGSTVGPLITSTTGIITVDLGVPQLSMHSSRELIATKDYVSLVSFLKETLQGCSCHATPSL